MAFAWIRPVLDVAGPATKKAMALLFAEALKSEALRGLLSEKAKTLKPALDDYRRSRNPEGRIEKGLVAVREVASAYDELGGDPAKSPEWRTHAGQIGAALQVVRVQKGPERKRTIKRLQVRTDELLAEVIEHLVPSAEEAVAGGEDATLPVEIGERATS